MKQTELNRPMQFFEEQFKRQVALDECELNPFEKAVLPYISGKVLDLGCGMGNLSIAAARNGATVSAYDASVSAIAALNIRAKKENLAIQAQACDLADFVLEEDFDTILCIGLLMFFPPAISAIWLDKIKTMTRPGGVVALNVLIAGTTYLDMFEPDGYTLFSEHELLSAFGGWKVEYSAVQEFNAPGNTIKRFSTVVVRKT